VVSGTVYRWKPSLRGKLNNRLVIDPQHRVTEDNKAIHLRLCNCGKGAVEVARSVHRYREDLNIELMRCALRLTQCWRVILVAWMPEYGDTRELGDKFVQHFKELWSQLGIVQ